MAIVAVKIEPDPEVIPRYDKLELLFSVEFLSTRLTES